MSKEKEKKPNYSTCLSFGMLFGVALGSAMGKIAVGLAIGFMFGTMYYNLFSKPDNDEYGAQNEVYNDDWAENGLIVLCFS